MNQLFNKKRVFDAVVSTLLTVIAMPIMLLVALFIKLDSQGPILYRQKRFGRDEVLFTIYKFRTMKMGTPEVATDLLVDRDQYVTRVGKVLRKTSLDELPQLVNILKGEMSFVGPRPALHNQYELIAMRREKGINRLVPGITGIAQINGRDALSDEQKVQYDEQYLHSCSVTNDIKIMMDTFAQVAAGKDIHN